MVETGCFCSTENLVVCDAIQKCDKLLHQLDGFTPLLEQNAKLTANEIMANFDAIINTLCDRRKLLLRQLEHVVRDKRNYIDSQKRSIETLRICMLKSVSAGQDIDQRLHDCITRSETAPFVSFRNNIALINEAILAYGQITTSFFDQFFDRGNPLTRLQLEVGKEKVSHIQEAVNSQATDLYTCTDPSIKKWLLDSHMVTSKSLYRGGSHVENKKESGASCLAPARPVYDLHMWLDQTNRPLKGSRRKLSNSFTTVDSDYSVNLNAEGKLNEWLFPDRMDTGETSGFAKMDRNITPLGEVQPPKPNDIEDLHQWLLPSTVKSAEQTPLFNAGGDCFSQADLTEDLVYVGDSVIKSAEAVSIVTLNSVDLLSANGCNQDCPTSAVKETSNGYDCIYSQCCGGPGGPTCCGGRPRPAAVATTASSSVKVTGSTVANAVQSNDAHLTPVSTSSHTTAPTLTKPESFAIVNQLVSIANSSLQQWLVGSSTNICSERPTRDVIDEEMTEISGPYDTSKWLMRSSADTNTSAYVLPSTGDSCWHIDTAVLKPVTQRQSSDRDYEGWLSRKLATCVSTV